MHASGITVLWLAFTHSYAHLWHVLWADCAGRSPKGHFHGRMIAASEFLLVLLFQITDAAPSCLIRLIARWRWSTCCCAGAQGGRLQVVGAAVAPHVPAARRSAHRPLPRLCRQALHHTSAPGHRPVVPLSRGQAGSWPAWDKLRLDHRVMEIDPAAGYWSVDAREETAMNGTWKKGPGKELFAALERVRKPPLGISAILVKNYRQAMPRHSNALLRHGIAPSVPPIFL